MLDKGIGRGIVVLVTNFIEEFLCPVEDANPCAIPYLEGEHWIDVAEDVIKVCLDA